MKTQKFNVGDIVICINDKFLGENEHKPPLEKDKEYRVNGIILDSKMNQHLDVGLKSMLNFVRSIETGQELKDGDKIHWCHPSRFENLSTL